MFNGEAATYSDIQSGFTFRRGIVDGILEFFQTEWSLACTILGASGVGKTTIARQLLLDCEERGWCCWEHKSDVHLSAHYWIQVADALRNRQEIGVLFVDNAHRHLQQVNELVDALAVNDNPHLKIVLSTPKNHWLPRIKSPNINRYGKTLEVTRLSNEEIDRLLNLLDSKKELRDLVEPQFGGFSPDERRRRLIFRCQSDMFVCLKNIFANDSFDDIILQEYASLDPAFRDVYRTVAALENSGVRVHRQLLIRLFSIPAEHVSAILTGLTDIVAEYDIEPRHGVYGWKCRHAVISSIVTRYKFSNIDELILLFDQFISSLSPAYDIEMRSIRELCNLETGLARIPDKKTQNRLLQMMISVAPGERIPRHRLIRNLIDMGRFQEAEAEIRIFQNDFGSDGPVYRYRVKLLIERALRTAGILEEDRIAILDQAYELASAGIDRYTNNKYLLKTYAELGVAYYKKTGNDAIYNDAIRLLKIAEEDIADPEISQIIRRYSQRMAGSWIAGDEIVDG